MLQSLCSFFYFYELNKVIIFVFFCAQIEAISTPGHIDYFTDVLAMFLESCKDPFCLW